MGGLQACVGATLVDELVVGALLDDGAVLHDDDGVGVSDLGKPARYDERGAPFEQCSGRLLYEGLGTGVDGTGRLVEHEDRGLGEEGPRDRSVVPAIETERSSRTVATGFRWLR